MGGPDLAEVKARDPKGVKARRADKWDFAPPGGESYAMLAERLRPWLASLSADAFVVSHGGVARVLMTYLRACPPRSRLTRPSFRAARSCSRMAATGGSVEPAGLLAPAAGLGRNDPAARRRLRLIALARFVVRDVSPQLVRLILAIPAPHEPGQSPRRECEPRESLCLTKS